MTLSIITEGGIVQLNLVIKKAIKINLEKQYLVVPTVVSISPRIRLLGTPSRIRNATLFEDADILGFWFCLVMQHSLFLQMEEPTC